MMWAKPRREDIRCDYRRTINKDEVQVKPAEKVGHASPTLG